MRFLLLPALLAACSTGSVEDDGASGPVADGGVSPVEGGAASRRHAFPTYRAPANAMFHAASLSGRLEIGEGCLYLQAASQRYLLILPEDSFSVNGSSLRFAGQEFRSGTQVSVGGSARGGTGIELPPPEARTHCTAGGIWIVARGGMAPA